MTLRITYPEFKVSGPGGPNSNVNTYYSGKVVKMNAFKAINRIIARETLTGKNIKWKSFNNDFHWKIGTIDFWPTTLKWIDNKNGELKEGLPELVNHVIGEKKITDPSVIDKKKLSVQQIAKIFIKNEGKSLMEKCELLHKEIYG